MASASHLAIGQPRCAADLPGRHLRSRSFVFPVCFAVGVLAKRSSLHGIYFALHLDQRAVVRVVWSSGLVVAAVVVQRADRDRVGVVSVARAARSISRVGADHRRSGESDLDLRLGVLGAHARHAAGRVCDCGDREIDRFVAPIDLADSFRRIDRAGSDNAR